MNIWGQLRSSLMLKTKAHYKSKHLRSSGKYSAGKALRSKGRKCLAASTVLPNYRQMIDIWLLSVSSSWENTIGDILLAIWGEALEHFCFTGVIYVEQINPCFPSMVFAWFICQSSRTQFSAILFNVAKTHINTPSSGLILWSDSHIIRLHTHF